jgi:hypothetical protein
MFMDSIRFCWKINWVYERFDCKINYFLSQFRFYLEGIKVWGSNYNFQELIWSNKGFNCINIEVWRPIKDLIKEIQKSMTKLENVRKYRGWNWLNQGLNWRNLKFINQLRIKMHKFRTKDQSEQDGQLQGWHLHLTRMQLNWFFRINWGLDYT